MQGIELTITGIVLDVVYVSYPAGAEERAWAVGAVLRTLADQLVAALVYVWEDKRGQDSW